MTPIKYFISYSYVLRLGSTFDKGFYSEIVDVGRIIDDNISLEDLTRRIQQDFCKRMHAEMASITIITLTLV